MPGLARVIWPSDEQEFEASFQQFVADGGLDTVDRRSEAYERHYRRNAYCEHGWLWRNCQQCHKEPKPYWTGH